jgi:predicted metalloprotease with PDZ domain
MFPQTEIVSDYKRFMELISHEFFHTWLVKGIAPAALVKPDLQREVYTRDLWLYEGVTSYYDLRQLLKAGIVDFKYFLNELAENYSNLRLYSGNKLESLADSSFNAWCGLYQANENFINTKTNYYRHGQILIFWLELILLLEGEMELDLVLKQLWQQYGKSKQPLPEGAEKVIAKILGRDYLTPLVHKPRLAELKTLLVKLGISCVTIPMEHNKKTGLLPQLGIYLAKDKFVVIRTLPNCLFQIDDELLAINERKLTAKNIQELLSVKKLKITIFRQGNLKHIEVLANSHLSYSFVANAKVTKEQKELQQKLGRVFD